MRKIAKTAAALTAGCMLLSTSAFAELTGTPAFENDKINVTVAGLGEGQSTILAVKGNVEAIPADLTADKIVYIDQKAAANGEAAYVINPGTYEGEVTIFAGGTNEATATKLGVVNTKKAIAAEGIVITGLEEGQALEIGAKGTLAYTLSPEGAEGKVVWSSSAAEVVKVDAATGAYEALTAGDAAITATVEGTQVSATVNVKVNAPAPARDFITTADTSKGTIKVDVVSIADASMGLAKDKAVVQLVLDTVAYPNAGKADAGYVVAVVDADGNAIQDAEVFYSKDRKKYVAVVPATVADYKFEVLPEGAPNVVLTYGDFNGDGKYILYDYMQFGKIYKGKALTGPVKNALNADVTGDGKVTIADYMQFGRIYKGKATTLPIFSK